MMENVSELLLPPNYDQNSPTITTTTSSSSKKTFGLSNRRWLMLFLWSFLNFTSGAQWMLFPPIAKTAMDYYNVSSFAVNSLSSCFMLCVVVGAFFGSWLLDTKGLRIGTVTCASLNFAGTVVRCFSCIDFGGRFYFAVLGQILAGSAQIFILGIGPLIASRWFSEKERTLCTSIGCSTNPVGVALAFFINPIIVNNSKDIIYLFLLQVGLSGFIWLAILLFFSNSPPSPPSLSAGSIYQKKSIQRDITEEKQVLYIYNIKALLIQFQFDILLLGSAFSIAGFWAFMCVLSQLLVPQGYSESVAGILGCTLNLVGVLSGPLTGLLLDRKRWYKSVGICLNIVLLFSMLGFAFANSPNHIGLLVIPIVVAGFCGSAATPWSLEALVETAFPCPEMLPSNAWGNSLTIIFICCMNPLIDNGHYFWTQIFLCGNCCIGVLLIILWRGKYSRLELERKGETSFLTTEV